MLKPPEKWLLSLLRTSEKKNWCTKIFCSTCNATHFRTALAEHLQETPKGLHIQEVIKAILHITPAEAVTLDAEKTFWSLGLVFYEAGIFQPFGKAYAEMPAELSGTWAEDFFSRVQPEIDAHNKRKDHSAT